MAMSSVKYVQRMYVIIMSLYYSMKRLDKLEKLIIYNNEMITLPPVITEFSGGGCIHPNLPAPPSCTWRCQPGAWVLSLVRGG